jgi:hypothetical protein
MSTSSNSNPAPASAAELPSEKTLRTIFDKQYTEFAEDLQSSVPELTTAIKAALQLSKEERLGQFVEQVLPYCEPTRDASKCPGKILPGVVLPEVLWRDLGTATQKAIQEHLTLLSFCCLYEGAKQNFDPSGNPTSEWSENFMKSWREKMGSIDFEGMSKKLTDLFTSMGPESLPKVPERLLKGHLGRLVEELLKEFKPEDFGLTPEELKKYDTDPMKSFELLTDIYTNRPGILQNAIKRIASRLQEKIRRGEIRPDQIALEAEEMMKEFSGNGAFVELMESFRGMFGMDNPEVARKTGNNQSARGSIVRDRLRKKMEAKRNNKK